MRIIDSIKRIFKRNNEEDIVLQLAESYHEKKDKGEENPIDTTIEKVMEIINQSDNPDLTAERILKSAIEIEEMPNRIPEKLSIIISKSDDISDNVITNAVNKSNTAVPDKMIENIIVEGDMGYNSRVELIKNVEDEEIIENRIKEEFGKIYSLCENKRDDEVVDAVKELKQILNNSEINMDTLSYIRKIVAKKMAENYYNDNIRSTKVYTLSQVYPINKMFEKNIWTNVEEEYNLIQEERGIKENRFDKDRLRMQILREIARNTGYKYRQSRIFAVPQSDNMKNITKDEEEVFISTLESAARKELDNLDIIELKEQIRGIIKNKETREMMLLDSIKEMPDKDKNIDMISNIVENDEKLSTLSIINKSGLLDELSKTPLEIREKTINAIKVTLENRINKKELKDKDDDNNSMDNAKTNDEENELQR